MSAKTSKTSGRYADGFDPKPTVFKGGIKRMVAIFNTLRDQNPGGYGPGVVQKIGNWFGATQNVTSCSPFTATVVGALMDPSGATQGAFQPVYDDGTKPLPADFYHMHNQNFFGYYPGDYSRFKSNGWSCNDAAPSVEFFGLGYRVKPKDLRRGDLVGINWASGHGHAVIVWDVHLDATGDVDAFCFISSNGGELVQKPAKPKAGDPAPAAGAAKPKPPPRKFFGNGITIAGCSGVMYGAGGKKYLSGTREEANLAAAVTPLFQDRESHIYDAQWYALPNLKAKIDRTTFKDPGVSTIYDHTNSRGYHVATLEAVRLWGIEPPDRPAEQGEAAIFDLAKHLAYERAPDSYATGRGKAPAAHIERVQPTVHKGEPEAAKTSPPKPAQQHLERPAPHQNFVEDALQRLYKAGWITNHPGDPKKVNDDETKKAVKEFQEKFNAKPVDGIAGPITRKALQQALQDLADGKPPSHEAAPAKNPRIDRVVWLSNRIEPGQGAFMAVHGVDLEVITRLHVTLKDRKSTREAQLAWDCVLISNVGVTPVLFPAVFERGAEVLATFSGTAGGTQVHYEHNVPIYIGKITPRTPDDWPWDEALWTQKMRDIIMDLRATPKPSGPFERWELTQYGVKEKMVPGDVQVRSKNGEVFGSVTRDSLLKADIEGTMRLGGRILNITQSGNVYEPVETWVDGARVVKNKPNASKFDPDKSLWTDVTLTAPWGAGAKMPLVPFRTLALRPRYHAAYFYRKVYIKQLDGMTMPNGEVHNGMCIAGDVGNMHEHHFDFCVGREDHHIQIPSVGGRGGTIVELQILEESAASRPGKKHG